MDPTPEEIAEYTAKAQEHIDAFFADGRTLPYDVTINGVTATVHRITINARGGLVVMIGLSVAGETIVCPDRMTIDGKLGGVLQMWVITNVPVLVPDPEGSITRSGVDAAGNPVTLRYSEDPLTIQRGGLVSDLILPILAA
jgi:hypothetical protein